MLTAAQRAARDGKLTASRVACLMAGDPEKIMRLWREMIGDVPEEDLSGVWAVQLGSATEALNLDWYERKTGRQLTRRGEVVIHPHADWAACTLDGWDTQMGCPVEAKHCGGREPLVRIVERYQPQLHWQVIVTCATPRAVLSVIQGADEPVIEVVPYNDDYGRELWQRARQFMECVWSLTPPVEMPAIEAPVIHEKIIPMAGNNEWADHATTWLENIAGKKKADAAEKVLKGMVPADAAKCHGHGVQITRNRAGALSLREERT